MSDGAAHYNPDDFAKLRPVEETHFWFVGRNNILGAALGTLTADGSRPRSVLEIGCGTGNALRVLREGLPDATLIGMDAFHAGLLYARSRTDASLVEGRIEHMPFCRRFDLIGMFDVLEHMEDDVAALRLVVESLEPGGRLMLTVPAGPSLWSRVDEESQHQRRYTDRHLRGVLGAAQCRVEYMTYFMSLTYPAVWISRRLERWFPAAPRQSAIERELHVPRVVNSVFRHMLRLEVPAIRRRYRLPFGTSILAIAGSSRP
jgi:SAM-dependent methyltransferase